MAHTYLVDLDLAQLRAHRSREENRPLPEPSREEASGKFVVRVPRSLHRRLQLLAQMENVSLNQLVTSLLAEREARESDGQERSNERSPNSHIPPPKRT